ncbi:LamG domain-containing protein [Sorangium sp. So ce302]|uniref:LamG domain-containing protein n=1 Tax=Sorangium sp. So ce302 TaxID=3133297 RepID=UPI003F60190A
MRFLDQHISRWMVAGLLLAGCSASDTDAEVIDTATQGLASAISFWRMNDCDPSSTALADSTFSAFHATRSASSACVDRPDGLKAVALDAEGERITTPVAAAYEFGTRFAVAAWINPTSIDFSTVRTIFRQGSGSSDIIAFQIGHGTLELSLNVKIPGSSTLVNIRGAAFGHSLSPGWMHVGATYDGLAIRLFINGQLVSTTSFGFSSPTPINGSPLSLEIGGAPPQNGSSRQFLGAIDDVWVSSQPVTTADMSELFSLPSCPEVDENKELLIRDLAVVEDPVRTTGDGVWTFKHLMEAMAPTPAQAPVMVEQMFQSWLSDQTMNTHVVPARTGIQSLVLDPWPRVDGALDLSRAPIRLLAIVNRLDLRKLADGKAGEGRFVFGVTDSSGSPLQFTIILEYRLPATTEAEVLDWANLWHELNALSLGSADYNAKLAEITERFAGSNAEPGRVNGSALSQLRTNEIALASPWELREFTLSPATGLLQPDTVKLTPDTSFMGQSIVADFINQNEASILTETHTVPEVFQGVSFLGGSSINDFPRPPWNAPGITNNEARHKFSLNACNGCHGVEAQTVFLHISPRFAGVQADISAFLEGTDVLDPVDGVTVRHLDDLERRATDMEQLLCAQPGPAAFRGTSGASSSFIAKGIDRVH